MEYLRKGENMKSEYDKETEGIEYLRDLEEWGEHQYSPGHWTGGNIPPQIKYGGKSMGYLSILLGLISTMASVIPLFDATGIEDILPVVPVFLISFILILAGIKKLRSNGKV